MRQAIGTTLVAALLCVALVSAQGINARPATPEAVFEGGLSVSWTNTDESPPERVGLVLERKVGDEWAGYLTVPMTEVPGSSDPRGVRREFEASPALPRGEFRVRAEGLSERGMVAEGPATEWLPLMVAPGASSVDVVAPGKALAATFAATDADPGDHLQFEFTWKCSAGNSNRDFTGFGTPIITDAEQDAAGRWVATVVLPADVTRSGEYWRVVARAYDGMLYSASARAVVHVVGSAPVAGEVTIEEQ